MIISSKFWFGKPEIIGNEQEISSLRVLPSDRENVWVELFLSMIERMPIVFPNVTSVILMFADN